MGAAQAEEEEEVVRMIGTPLALALRLSQSLQQYRERLTKSHKSSDYVVF